MIIQPLKKCPGKDLAAYGVIGIAVVFYILTIRHGHDWGGDFALYIENAINIATGHPYSDTWFVYNTRDPLMSPRSYPPVYPLLLAPVYRMFGLDLYAMKVAGILVFAGFLLLYYRYACNRLESPLAQILVVACMAFSPWFWEAKDRILPDFLFIVILYASIVVADRMYALRRPGLPQYLLAVGAGLLVSLLYGTRSVGMLIVPAFFLHDIIRRRLVSRATLIVTIVFAAFYVTQNVFLHTDQSYFDSLKSVDAEEQGLDEDAVRQNVAGEGLLTVIKNNIDALGDRIPRKLHSYGSMMSAYWYIGDSVVPAGVLLALMTVLAVAGFVDFIARSPSIGDYFALTYILILLVVPFGQQRYLLPLVPLYLLYIFRATERIKQLASSRGAGLKPAVMNAVPVIVSVVIAASYASSYALSDSGPIARGVESSESRELFDFIRRNTPEDSLLVFHKPRPLALFTGRHALKYHWEPDVDKLWRDLTDMGATHIVLPKYIDTKAHRDYYFPAIVERHRRKLELIFENDDFVVYRILRDAAG